jgi:hypothetical protein
MGVGDMKSRCILYAMTPRNWFWSRLRKTDSTEQLNAEADDLIVYMTSQEIPFSLLIQKIKRTMAHFINTWH